MGNPTYKQKEFAKAVSQGMTLSDAYRHAYDAAGSKAKTIQCNASAIAQGKVVRGLIEAETAKKERSEQRSLSSKRAWILRRLEEEADSTSDSPASRVKSLEILAKLSGLMTSPEERAEARQNATEENLLAELRTRLTDLIEQPIEIDTVEVVERSETQTTQSAVDIEVVEGVNDPGE